MKVLEARQKAMGAQLLKRLTSDKYMQQFIDAETVYLFDNDAPTVTVNAVPDVASKLREIERKQSCKVYAVVHSVESHCNCYAFLNVPKYPEDWKYLVTPCGMIHSYAHAYVWNKTSDYLSESGSVVVQWYDGKLWRVG